MTNHGPFSERTRFEKHEDQSRQEFLLHFWRLKSGKIYAYWILIHFLLSKVVIIMRSRKKYFPLLFLGLLSLLGVVFYIFLIDPSVPYEAGNVTFSPVIFFFILLVICLSCFFSFFLKNLRRGILISIFLSSILLLKFFGYLNIFSVGIIFVITVLLELGFKKK